MVPVNDTEEEADKKEQESQSEENDSNDEIDNDTASSEESENKEEQEKEESKPKLQKVEKEVTKTVKIPLNITKVEYTFTRMSEEVVSASATKLKKMEEQEEEKRQTEKAKNELESFVYELRDKLADEEGSFFKVTTSEFREKLSGKLLEMEDWLMFEGESETAPIFKDKLKVLKKDSDPVHRRVFEFEHRDKAIEELRGVINLVKISVVAWPDIKPWLNQTDIDALVKQADDVNEWLETKLKEQEGLAVYEDPVLKVSEMTSKGNQLMKQFNKLGNKKPPRLPPSPKPSNTTDDKNQTIEQEQDTIQQESTQDDVQVKKESESEQTLHEEL
eukprot:TRINITY_DN21687_c0_g1_i8.p1 TRINITY_DN21687_c0_g1~~TRINITY_DN21687_c0_g1_i8.p1  ORF type:complete len:379 (-),score=137.98 TRINITY_DN21687_c0_g1_i8:228-1223(-)